MKIDFTRQLHTLAGEPMTLDGVPATLGSVCANALLAQGKEETLSGDEKVRHFRLAAKVHGAQGGVTVTVEEAALIKERVARLYPPLVSGQAWDMIDGEAE